MNFKKEQEIAKLLRPEVVFSKFAKHLPVVVDKAKDPLRVGGVAMYALLPYGGDEGKNVILQEAQLVGQRTFKYEQYQRNARNKFYRLLEDPSALSAWESRNEAHDWWGGGIRVPFSPLPGQLYSCILTFSGLPEELDELLCLLVARSFGLVEPHMVRSVYLWSKNQYIKGFFSCFLKNKKTCEREVCYSELTSSSFTYAYTKETH